MRRAFTLFELLLVLALLVILAGIALPSINAMYADSRVTAAVDQVQAHWAAARSHAIREGRPYRFAVAVNGNGFRVAPDSPEFWGGGDSPSAAEGREPPMAVEDALPNGIRFADDNGSVGEGAGGWTPVAVFLPDGTARDDAEILFRGDNTRTHRLKLRGLTGCVTSRVLPPDEGP
jgi:prepilin-type N-terminal cleavage/methylation domain-containing protein